MTEHEDIPELTDEDFKRAKPISEALPELAASLKKRGRPKVETPKLHIGFRLSADIVERIRATGKGYNRRVERVLREALDKGRL